MVPGQPKTDTPDAAGLVTSRSAGAAGAAGATAATADAAAAAAKTEAGEGCRRHTGTGVQPVVGPCVPTAG